MKRRKFLKIAGSTITLSPWLEKLVIAADDSAAGTGVLDDSPNPDIRSLFESNSEEALKLTEDVFRKCILEKIMQPIPPLNNTWIVPGGPYYKGQWIWDTMFVVDLLSILPGKKKVIRDIFQNYWDFQDRWNAKMPDYAQDMIPSRSRPNRRRCDSFRRYRSWPGVLSVSIVATATSSFSDNA